ncbi:hypothetical protein HC766_02105 [Candidatus Gracilibacteria bacterium]|nr:hypothetical protein [Candidatus Gracilibacteria bacterium]
MQNAKGRRSPNIAVGVRRSPQEKERLAGSCELSLNDGTLEIPLSSIKTTILEKIQGL